MLFAWRGTGNIHAESMTEGEPMQQQVVTYKVRLNYETEKELEENSVRDAALIMAGIANQKMVDIVTMFPGVTKKCPG
jgi:hypothetical protein